jgi:hypothetical protein
MRLISYSLILLASTLGASTALAAEPPGSQYEFQLSEGKADLQAQNAERAVTAADAAVRINPDRWEGYALAGDALLGLKRYEDAADALSKAIERAPAAMQAALRERRRAAVLAESELLPVHEAPPPPPPRTPSFGRVPPAKEAREAAGLRGSADPVWVDPESGLMWARPWYYPPSAPEAPWNFAISRSFCAALQLIGFGDWRLPTFDELQRVYLVSGKGWRWTVPKFSAGYGINAALKADTWRPASFVIGADTFAGNRLLIWTSTAGAADAEHTAIYFGRRFSVGNELRLGTSLKGERTRNPFQGYALCVRAAQ